MAAANVSRETILHRRATELIATALIAIDGPGGVGKSTVARSLSDALGYYFLSSGMIYRAMAWHMLGQGWRTTAVPHPDLLRDFAMRIGGAGELWINDRQVTADLNTEEISAAASLISAVPQVRDRSNQVQRDTVRRIGEEGTYPGVILEGRDIGTIVFPDATYKFFLTASEEIRAERRFKEQQPVNPGLTQQAVQKTLGERDRRDETRDVAPLKAADDAIVIDTSTLSLTKVVETMLETILAGTRQE